MSKRKVFRPLFFSLIFNLFGAYNYVSGRAQIPRPFSEIVLNFSLLRSIEIYKNKILVVTPRGMSYLSKKNGIKHNTQHALQKPI